MTLRAMKKSFITLFSIFFFAGAGMLHAENIGVPAECEDVMLQAFYWDSYTLTKYGRTKWVDLVKDTAAINADFDLVWFPPSAVSTGGVGYYHTCLSNQDNTAWGTKTKLTQLINGLHAGGTKVLGDIVINHRGNKSSWVDFYQDNFGQYGTWQLTQEHICSGDEAFTDSSSPYKGSATHGAADTGTNETGCRDLDHKSEYVQNWAKAYVQWMRDVMKYDGFRYDMTLGYSGSYLGMYNEAGQPYFSVSEYWVDSPSKQVTHLKATGWNTTVFDFPLKFAIGNALKAGNYRLLVNPSNSLRNKGYSRYAVTFIDNHDTFERSDNQGGEFIKYNADLSDATVKSKILQANAYILMLPGVPCVFWPHWKSYQENISALIAIRKEAGIHSESTVLREESANNVYEVEVQGHRGKVLMRMGANRSKDVPEGYTLALEGDGTAEYTIFIRKDGQGMVDVQSAEQSVKFIRDGKLYIRRGELIYDILGNKIQ